LNENEVRLREMSVILSDFALSLCISYSTSIFHLISFFFNCFFHSLHLIVQSTLEKPRLHAKIKKKNNKNTNMKLQLPKGRNTLILFTLDNYLSRHSFNHNTHTFTHHPLFPITEFQSSAAPDPTYQLKVSVKTRGFSVVCCVLKCLVDGGKKNTCPTTKNMGKYLYL